MAHTDTGSADTKNTASEDSVCTDSACHNTACHNTACDNTDCHNTVEEWPERLANYQRRFNRPTGLIAEQPVQLIIQSPLAPRLAILNSQALTLEHHGTRYSAQIHPYLVAYNRLQLTFSHSHQLRTPPSLASFAEIYLGIQDCQ